MFFLRTTALLWANNVSYKWFVALFFPRVESETDIGTGQDMYVISHFILFFLLFFLAFHILDMWSSQRVEFWKVYNNLVIRYATTNLLGLPPPFLLHCTVHNLVQRAFNFLMLRSAKLSSNSSAMRRSHSTYDAIEKDSNLLLSSITHRVSILSKLLRRRTHILTYLFVSFFNPFFKPFYTTYLY